MPTLAAAVTDFAATLKAENDRAEQSPLSPAEIVIAAEIEPQTDHLWQMYRSCLHAAQRAREAVRARLRAGLPAIVQLPDGGFDAMAGIAHLEASELIDKYTHANRRLWDAAQTLCDCLELADDGEAEHVIWECPMVARRPH
jgi:hypothetical protein